MKGKRTGHIDFVGAKLDMAKAYDRLEWSFIDAIMTPMNFPRATIKVVMDCISTVTFSIFINGNRIEEFYPERDVRQGDPLSSFLFIVTAEGMCAFLDDAANRNAIRGFKVAKDAPAVTHLCFADDSIIFFRAKDADCTEIAKILNMYEEASGQLVNLEKSGLWFSRNTSNHAKCLVQHSLKINRIIDNDNYLGLPLFLSNNMSNDFRYVMDNIRSKIQHWNNRYLYQADKEVMLKSVA